MKKLLSFILILAMMITMAVPLSLTASAAFASLSMSDNGAVAPGGYFRMTVSLDSNPGIAAMKVTIDYDTSAFELRSIDNGTVFGGTFTENKDTGKATLETFNPKVETKATGRLLTFNFQVKSGASIKDYEFKVTATAVDSKLKRVMVTPATATYRPFGDELKFENSEWYEIAETAIGTTIPLFSVANGVSGGVKPYTFSKTSGPSWLNVSESGTVTGTAKNVMPKSTLVVRVTDNTGDYREIEIPVGATVPDSSEDRIKINRVSVFGTGYYPEYGDVAGPLYMEINEGGPVCLSAVWGVYRENGLPGGEFNRIADGTKFEVGKQYQYRVTIAIKDEAVKTHVLSEYVEFKVDNVKWKYLRYTTDLHNNIYVTYEAPEPYEIVAPTPVITPDSTTFKDSVKITMSLPIDEDDLRIFYRAYNPDTVESVPSFGRYKGPFTVTDHTVVEAYIAHMSDNWITWRSEMVTAEYKKEEEPITVATPSIKSHDGSTTFGGTILVYFNCATDGAKIYYTTDGSTPSATNGTAISDGGSLYLYKTTTVKAIAVKNGVTSKIATQKFTQLKDDIPKVEISLDTPVAGNTVSAVSIPTDAKYILESVYWYEGTTATGTVLSESAVYEKGKKYTLLVSVKAKDGYEFSVSNTSRIYLIDGNAATRYNPNSSTNICTIGYTFTASAPHSCYFNQELIKPNTLRLAATCTRDAIYYKSCTCGRVSKSATFTVKGSALGHKWSTVWSSSASKHWHECTVCHEKKDEAAHIPGASATETKPQICTVCEYVIKAPIGHTHSFTEKNTDAKFLVSAATCTAKAVYYYSCACGAKGTATFENGSVSGHSYSWESDLSYHYRKCSLCGDITEGEAHRWNDATIITEADKTLEQKVATKCRTCGHEFEGKLGEISKIRYVGDYMYGVQPGTTVEALTKELGNVKIEGAKGKFVATGTRVTVDGKTYTVIIRGDTNGDGKISAADYMAIRQHLLKIKTLDGVALKAAHITTTEDKSINASDYISARLHILRKKIIVQ